MRARFLNEKFEDQSDPIHDMGIGKVDFSEIHHEILGPAEMEWDERIGEMLYGKTITGIMRRLHVGYAGLQGVQYTPGLQGPGPTGIKGTQGPTGIQGTTGTGATAKYKVKVKDYQGNICTGAIHIKGDDGTLYELLTNEEEYIIE
jgi:hypothetical protein